jgi:DNA-binding protein HU-beta
VRKATKKRAPAKKAAKRAPARKATKKRAPARKAARRR